MAELRRQGFTLELYHKTAGDFDEFAPFQHFGTVAQANMRAVGEGANIRPVMVRGRKWRRMRDTGSWDEAKLRRLERQGYDGVVYLNRYEGVPLEEFEAARARGIDVDSLPDGQFRRAVPSATDSYIVFDPRNVRSRLQPPIDGLLSVADDDAYHNLDPARQVIAEEPDLTLPTERGEEPAMAALDNAEAARQDAEGLRQGFEAAVRCAIRHAGALSGRAGQSLNEAARSIIIGQGAGATAAIPLGYGISAFASQDALERATPREAFRQRTAEYNLRHPLRIGEDGYLDAPLVNLPEIPQETMGRGADPSVYGARPVEYPGIRDTGLDTTNTASFDRNTLTGAPLFPPADAPEGSLPPDSDPRIYPPGQARLPRYRDNQ